MSDAFSLFLPATSANLGPAFDAAALALSFGLRVQARRAEAFAITAAGRDAGICGNLNDHLILEVYRRALAEAGQAASPLALHLDNDIPIGKGCGSSAAARLAGLALAAHFGDLGWSAQHIFEAAVGLEGHPDNVAACWWGGLVVASGVKPTRWLGVPATGTWPLLIAVPAAALSTEQARRVLPERYSRADAVANLQNALLLVQALQQGRGDLLAAALEDRWHQPYRAGLCPLLPALQPLAGRDGVLGVALSGAGPSVLMFLAPEARSGAREAARTALQRAGLEAELIEASVEGKGPGRDWGRA